jgi:diaminopimelate epimerase
VNFVTGEPPFTMRTYERGVEAETLSCGTGTVAAAIAIHSKLGMEPGRHRIELMTRGGKLEVAFMASSNGYEAISLRGPVKKVFSGLLTGLAE